jgi:protein-tyrosine-phosphatase
MTETPEVLFVCTHYAGRSQMAAALLDHQAAGRVHVTSAGSQPASQLNPAVVQAMAEIGLDISRELPKPLTPGKVQAADVVITMGCDDTCPVYPGQRHLDWDLPDPAGLTLDQVRPIRDDIAQRVRRLLDELTATSTS